MIDFKEVLVFTTSKRCSSFDLIITYCFFWYNIEYIWHSFLLLLCPFPLEIAFPYQFSEVFVSLTFKMLKCLFIISKMFGAPQLYDIGCSMWEAFSF